MIDNFRGRWFFLSNFSPSVIVHKGITYPTVEHYYVAMKVNGMQFYNGRNITEADFREMIAKIATPNLVKQLGRTLVLRSDWDENKAEVMRTGLKLKFKDEVLANLLLSTNDEELIERNWWHDIFYGQCSCDKCFGKGKNILGKLLMEIRSDLRGGLSNGLGKLLK